MSKQLLQKIEKENMRKDVDTDVEVGDTVRVHMKIREGDKERIQVFEGVVIRQKRGGLNAAVTVRKVAHGVGVERIFPIHAPAVDKIEVKAKGKVRRSRLYYLRDRSGKAARIKARTTVQTPSS
ncbi:MAG: 50S ribosomal protein L19 [Deltaproteobacteria bacterium]|nr:50S ribosomal protein L19 [Deltaproteobacteria bacterium]